jgi:RNA polymerase sigma-70 factor (ECF subfamily)
VTHGDQRPPLDHFTQVLIRRKVRKLMGRAGFTQQDRQDLVQELTLKLLQRLPSFDPSKAPLHAFITLVVERCVANMIRDQQAPKRQWLRSLQERPPDKEGSGAELAQTLSQWAQDARRGVFPRSAEEQAQLAADVAAVLASLPPEQRDLAERLMTQSLSAIARDKGVPRTTLYTLVRRLRERFQRAGLQDYF